MDMSGDDRRREGEAGRPARTRAEPPPGAAAHRARRPPGRPAGGARGRPGDSDDDGDATSAASPTTAAAETTKAPASSAPTSQPAGTTTVSEPPPLHGGDGARHQLLRRPTSSAAASCASATSAAGKAESFNPARRRRLDRHLAAVPDLRPAHARQPGPHPGPGPRARVEPERRRDGLYEVKLRPDVVFHDGKSFTADDVIYSLRQMGDEKHLGHFAVTNIDLDELKKLDDLTRGDPAQEPERRLLARVRERHHGDGAGRRDRLHQADRDGPVQVRHVHARRAQPLAREPGLLGGGQAVRRRVGGHLDRRRGGAAERAAPRRDRRDEPARLPAGEGPPGDGRHLRRERAEPVDALLLHGGRHRAVRRPEGARGLPPDPGPAGADRRRALGFGTLGNDLFGKGYKYFADDLPSARPTPRRRRRCSRRPATRTSTVTLHTSDAVPGFVESATLFAQQAKAAGVTVNVKKEAANAFFDTSLLYTKLDFSQDFWAAGSLGAWYELALLSDAAWNETHWREPEYDKLIREAQGATDEKTAEASSASCSRSSTTRAATSSGRTSTSSTASANYVKGIGRARSPRSAAGTTGAPGSTRERRRSAARPAAPRRACASGRRRRGPGHCVRMTSSPRRPRRSRRRRRAAAIRSSATRPAVGRSLTLFVVSMLVFAATEVLPGDAASAVLGRRPRPPELAEMRERWASTSPPSSGTPTGSAACVTRRPRQLGGRLRAGRRAADRDEISARSATRSSSRGSTIAAHGAALARCSASLAGDASAGRPPTTRSRCTSLALSSRCPSS